MHCPTCGTENAQDTNLCSKCGAAFSSVPPPPSGPSLPQFEPSKPTKTSGFAIASFILGILVFFTFGITSVPAIICGIIGLMQTKNGRLAGNGLAIAGLATGIGSSLFLAVIATILFFKFDNCHEKAHQTHCLANQKQIALAAAMYAQDHGEVWPKEWEEFSANVPSKCTICPSQPKYHGNSYGMNESMRGLPCAKVTDPSIILFTADCANGRGYIGSPAEIAPRHSNGFIASFVDGHVAYLKVNTPVTFK